MFGACAWERVDGEAPWDDCAVPPYGSYTMRLLSDGDIILHWNKPHVAVYLDGEGARSAVPAAMTSSTASGGALGVEGGAGHAGVFFRPDR